MKSETPATDAKAEATKPAAAKSVTEGKKDDATASSATNNSKQDGEPLYEFFVDSLKDMLWAETAILEALPKMKKAATTDELQEAFEDHELQTRKHVSRLEKAFQLLGETAEAKKCDAMAGIIKEGEHIITSTPDGSMTRDAALIIAAQKVEHYEIASYGGLVQLALTLDHNDVADLLEKTLQEEEDTDAGLTDIAESFINFEAGNEGEEDVEENGI
jgi:ferritin-like metal-binding protein YciE